MKNNKTSKSVQKEEENEKRKGYRIGYGIYYGSVCFGIAVTMLNTNAAVKAKKITMAKKATLEVGAKKKLKVTVKPAKAKVKITSELLTAVLLR